MLEEGGAAQPVPSNFITGCKALGKRAKSNVSDRVSDRRNAIAAVKPGAQNRNDRPNTPQQSE